MGGNRNFTVGLFVSAAIAILMVFTVWITGLRGNEPTNTYSIMIQNDVSGLSLGGPVYYLGVAVGEVTEMAIVSGEPPAIRVDIEVLETTPIDAGTRATLAAQGITGVSVINLSSEHGEHPPLAKTPGFDHPLIPFRDSGFAALLSSAPKVLEKIETLLDHANELMSETNLATIQQVLDNVEQFSAALASEESGVAELPAALHATMTDLRGAIADVRKLVEDSGPGVITSIENIERTTAQLASVSARLESWLSENEDAVHQFVGDGLGQVPELIGDTRAVLRELEQLLERLRQDPSALIYQPEHSTVPVEE